MRDASPSSHEDRGGIVTLRRGGLEAQLHPSLGARLGRLRRLDPANGQQAPFDYIVPVEAQGFDLNRWQRAGCFPMLPFTNKFPRNTLAWADANLCVGDPDGPAWLHGWGLRSAWSVELVSDTHCTLAHAFPATQAWPWHWRAKLAFDFDADDAITLTLVVLNESDRPMPLGLGFHPYFPIPGAISGAMRATVQAAALWRPDDASDGLPARRETLGSPIRLDLRRGALPGDTFSWFCETGAGAHAVIDYPEAGHRITLTSTEASQMVVHFRAGEQYLCLEPCTHLAGTLDALRDAAMPHVPVEFAMRLLLE
jgi:aldose 1-epimerase